MEFKEGKKSHAYTFGADIWSLGCIIAFNCNRGKHLFQAKSNDELTQKMNNWTGLPQGAIPLGPPKQGNTNPPPEQGYTKGLVDLIARMLDPDRQKRPSAKEIYAECLIDDRQKFNVKWYKKYYEDTPPERWENELD